jgi:uncharacterized lipoprotein YddW (UPF0748 family)
MKKLIVTTILFAFFAANIFSQQNREFRGNSVQEPRREFRGTWVHTVGNSQYKEMTTDQMKQHFIDLLDEFESAKINAVIFQVRPQADAFYKNSIEPWSRFITGTQGVAPSPLWDPLQFMVEECHKRGMELHAWFNPYRVTSNDQEVLCPDHLYYKKPHLFVKYGKQIYFDPGEPEAREHTLKVIADVVRRYDIDAVHFDDYFYPYKVADENKKIVDFPDSKSFEKYGKADGYTQETRDDWRRNNVNVLIKALNETIKGIKPWVKFGISPFGVWRNIKNDPTGSNTDAGVQNYDDLYADIKLWVEKRWIDYNVPQLYFDIGHPKADYQILLDWWSENNYGENLYIGQALNQTVRVKSRKNEGEYENQLPRKMETTRNNKNVHGNVWWSGYEMKRNRDGFINQLKSYHQTKIALMPKYKNIDTIAPEPLRELKIEKQNSENYFVWTATPTSDLMQTAAYYCIYSVEKVGDDINTKSPAAITPNTKFKVPKSGIYAVTVLDKLQNESSPKYIEVK